MHGRKRRSPAKFGAAVAAAAGAFRATEAAEAEVENIQQAQSKVVKTDQGGDGQHTHGGDGQIQEAAQVQEDALTQASQQQQSTLPIGRPNPYAGGDGGMALGTGTQAPQQGGSRGLFGGRKRGGGFASLFGGKKKNFLSGFFR